MSQSLPLIKSIPQEGAIKAAFELCAPREVLSQEELNALIARKAQLVGAKTNMLGIEQEACQIIEDEIRRITRRIDHANGLVEINPVIFSWRDQDGWPSLAPFELRDNYITIGDGSSTSGYMPFFKYYDDIFDKLKARKTRSFRGLFRPSTILLIGPCVVFGAVFGYSFPFSALGFYILAAFLVILAIMNRTLVRIPARSITAQYKGAIPADVRQLIREKSQSFDKIVILAEVDKWVVDEIVTPKSDPLVVGYNRDTDQWFLLAVYDTTPIERLIAGEFTT